MKVSWRRSRAGGGPGALFWETVWLPKRLFLNALLELPRQSAFCMVFDCSVVRLSFGLKDCRAARANGAYADSTTKTDGLKQFLKLCFCAGERRGEQNTHGSGKKTHATKAFKIGGCRHF